MMMVEKDDEETNDDEGVSDGETRNANVQGLDNIGVDFVWFHICTEYSFNKAWI